MPRLLLDTGTNRSILNVSSLAMYAQCPRLFYLSQVEGIRRETVHTVLGRIEHDARRVLSAALKRSYAALQQSIKAKDLAQIGHRLIRDTIQYETNIALHQYPIYSREIEAFLLELEYRLVREDEERLLVAHSLLLEGVKPSQLVMTLFPFKTELPLYSEELGLRGRVDEIYLIDGSYIPTDIKTTPYPFVFWDASAVQVAAYSMLIEKQFSVEVEVGRVYYTRSFLRQEVPLRHDMRATVIRTIQFASEAMNDSLPEPLNGLDQVKCAHCHLAFICKTFDGTGISNEYSAWIGRLFQGSEPGDLSQIYDGVK